MKKLNDMKNKVGNMCGSPLDYALVLMCAPSSRGKLPAGSNKLLLEDLLEPEQVEQIKQIESDRMSKPKDENSQKDACMLSKHESELYSKLIESRFKDCKLTKSDEKSLIASANSKNVSEQNLSCATIHHFEHPEPQSDSLNEDLKSDSDDTSCNEGRVKSLLREFKGFMMKNIRFPKSISKMKYCELIDNCLNFLSQDGFVASTQNIPDDLKAQNSCFEALGMSNELALDQSERPKAVQLESSEQDMARVDQLYLAISLALVLNPQKLFLSIPSADSNPEYDLLISQVKDTTLVVNDILYHFTVQRLQRLFKTQEAKFWFIYFISNCQEKIHSNFVDEIGLIRRICTESNSGGTKTNQ